MSMNTTIFFCLAPVACHSRGPPSLACRSSLMPLGVASSSKTQWVVLWHGPCLTNTICGGDYEWWWWWWWWWMIIMTVIEKNGCMAKLIKHQNQQGHVIIIKFKNQPIDPRWMALSLKLDCIPAEVLSHDPGCAWPDLGDLFLGACIQYGLFGDSWLAATCRWPVELLPLEVVGSWKRSKSEGRSECIACRCTQSARKRPAAEVVLGSVLGWKKHAVMGGNGCPRAQHIYSWPMAKIGFVFLWIYTIEHTRSRSDRFQRFLKRLHPIVCCWSIGFNCLLKLSDPTELNYLFVNCEKHLARLEDKPKRVRVVSVWMPRYGNKGTRWESEYAGVFQGLGKWVQYIWHVFKLHKSTPICCASFFRLLSQTPAWVNLGFLHDCHLMCFRNLHGEETQLSSPSSFCWKAGFAVLHSVYKKIAWIKSTVCMCGEKGQQTPL